MADYYPLIARAIAGLDPSAPGESRRALYERARAALIAQLRSVEPPLSESEITRERLSLEEAVRKVESEAAQRARDASRSGGAAPRRRRALAPAMPSAPIPVPMRGRAKRPPPSRRQPRHRRVRRRRAPRRQPPRGDRPPLGQEDRRPPQREASRRCAATATRPPPSRRSRCRIRSCRRPANDRARRAAAPTTARRRRRACAAFATSPPTPTISAAPRRRPAARREKPMPTCRRPRRSSTGSSRAWRTAAPIPTRPIRMTNSIEEAERYAPPQHSPRRARASAQDREPKKRARSGAVFPFKSAIAVGIVLILVGAAILWGKSVVTAVSGLFKPSPTVVEAPKDPARRCRSRRFPIASASRRRPTRSRRWRSAWCCMTRIPPIPRASNMSAR